jgi:DNA-directed RNA polymerase subunit M/transcription elongation factor TFIIS
MMMMRCAIDEWGVNCCGLMGALVSPLLSQLLSAPRRIHPPLTTPDFSTSIAPAQLTFHCFSSLLPSPLLLLRPLPASFLLSAGPLLLHFRFHSAEREMHFCPTCANLLHVSQGSEGHHRFFCKTCPYVHAIKKAVAQRTYLQRKEVDDVLGGADAWKNVDQTEGQKPKTVMRARAVRQRGLLTVHRYSCSSLYFPLFFPLFVCVRLSSPVSEVRERPCILHADPNAFSGRAHDHLLQMHQLRMRGTMEGGIESDAPCYAFAIVLSV